MQQQSTTPETNYQPLTPRTLKEAGITLKIRHVRCLLGAGVLRPQTRGLTTKQYDLNEISKQLKKLGKSQTLHVLQKLVAQKYDRKSIPVNVTYTSYVEHPSRTSPFLATIARKGEYDGQNITFPDGTKLAPQDPNVYKAEY